MDCPCQLFPFFLPHREDAAASQVAPVSARTSYTACIAADDYAPLEWMSPVESLVA